MILWLAAALATDAASVVADARASVARVDAVSRGLSPEVDALVASLGDVHGAPGAAHGQRGSAVVVSTRGDLLTSYHVVAGASDLTITYDDGTSVPGTVVRADPSRDLAWVSAPHDTRPVALAGAPVRQGQAVLTLGYPAGDSLVVSQGIVSGNADRGVGAAKRQRWLLTDALVQRGGSGGPMLDLQGRVLGMSTGGFERGSGADGLGLVLPVEVLADLWSRWQRPRAPLGARLRVEEGGIRVVGVLGAVDVQVDDLIVAIDGRPIGAVRDVIDAGVGAMLTVQRGAARLELVYRAAKVTRAEVAFTWRGIQFGADGQVVEAGALGRASGLDVADRVLGVAGAEGPLPAALGDVEGVAWLDVSDKGWVAVAPHR